MLSKVPCSFFLILFFVLFSACSKKLFVNESDLLVESFDFNYFSAKAKIDYEDGKNNFDATANIRMQKDSVIWISITPGLGVEAARLMVLTDSVIFIDRINKKYFASNFEKLKEKYEFQFDFNMLESILLGNIIFPYDKEKLVQKREGTSYIQNKDSVVYDNFIGKQSKKLERISITDIETNTTISVNYSDFKFLEEEVFPFSISTLLEYYSKGEKKTKLEIKFNKAQIEEKPLRFPFNVPSKYTAM